jgi:uncharacterized protein (TIGR02679 family)
VGAADRERLRRLLGGPELAWILQRARGRLEREQPLDGAIGLAGASAAQRRAVERLLGRAPRPGASLTVSLPALDELLRRSGACAGGLAGAVVELGGPIVLRAEAHAARERAWERAFGPLAELAEGRPELAGWVAGLRDSGRVRRLAPDAAVAGGLLRRLAAVVAALPAEGEPIGRFAARTAGGAHALDDGSPLATLALSAAQALAGLPACAAHESRAEWRREVWAAVGLLRDELSSTVLTLGLATVAAPAGAGRLVHAAGATGQPLWLTLRQLVREPPRWDAAGQADAAIVHICENPVVVAVAADALGARCPPLVCTNGQPVAATMVLLRELAAAGAQLVHHGDFDWGGIRIGNVLHARLPVRPWRFDAEAYARASLDRDGPPLRGAPVVARWDPDLAPLLRDRDRAVEEEQVLDDLLGDLARCATAR